MRVTGAGNLQSWGRLVPRCANSEIDAAPFQYQIRRAPVSSTSRLLRDTSVPANTPLRSPRTITYFPFTIGTMFLFCLSAVVRYSASWSWCRFTAASALSYSIRASTSFARLAWNFSTSRRCCFSHASEATGTVDGAVAGGVGFSGTLRFVPLSERGGCGLGQALEILGGQVAVRFSVRHIFCLCGHLRADAFDSRNCRVQIH